MSTEKIPLTETTTGKGKPPVMPSVAMPVPKVIDLSTRLGCSAIFDPSSSDKSTMFPTGPNCFALVDPTLQFAKGTTSNDWKKFRAAVARGNAVKPLVDIYLIDPDTGERVACLELKIGKSSKRLLGGWVEIDGGEVEGKEIR